MSQDKVTLSDGTTIKASKRDSLHTALCGLYEAAQKARDQAKANGNSGESMSRQDAYVSFLHKVTTGPRKFFDPEGTGYQTTYKNNNYRKAFGQTSPGIETVANEDIVSKVYGGVFNELQGDTIDPQTALQVPVTPDGEPCRAVPVDLDEAKGKVKSIVLEQRPEATAWFDYMAGDESALDDSGSTADSDDIDKEEWCQAITDMAEIKGIGPKLAEDIRTHIATRQSAIVLDPDDINKEVSLGDQYDGLTDYQEQHGAEAVAELTPSEIKDLSN